MFYYCRNPVAQSTDACRGKIGFQTGRHSWEVIWEGPLGTVAVIGIATKHAPLISNGYVALLGSDEHSWGWNLVDNHLLHNGESLGNFPLLLNNAPKYQVTNQMLFDKLFIHTRRNEIFEYLEGLIGQIYRFVFLIIIYTNLWFF